MAYALPAGGSGAAGVAPEKRNRREAGRDTRKPRSLETDGKGETLKVALYARVSTTDQNTENQLLELRRYVAARGWSGVEYIDHGVSSAKDRRPALDQLVADVRCHRVQGVVCWRLNRLGRNLRHLVMLLDDWQSRGIAFVTLGEGIDTSTAAGRLVAGVLGSIAEFERARTQRAYSGGTLSGQGARHTPRSPTVIGRAKPEHLRRALARGCGDTARGLSREHQTLAPCAGGRSQQNHGSRYPGRRNGRGRQFIIQRSLQQ